MAMFLMGIGLLGSIFLSFGCLIAAFNSLASLTREAYNSESRTMAIAGFVGGLIASAVFGLTAILLLNRLSTYTEMLAQ